MDVRRFALVAVLLLVAAPVPARHLEDGGYRCDGGWCRDGDHREIVCTGDGCRGETRGFPTVIDPPVGDGSWLPDDDWVLGVEVDGQVLAFPLERVREESVVRVDFADRRLVATYRGDNVHVFDAGDRALQRTDDPDWLVDDDGQRYHAVTGRTPDGGDGLAKIPGKTTFTTRWDLFHPDSSYYQGGGAVSKEAPETGLLPGPGFLAAAAALAAAWVARRCRHA